MDDLKNCCFLFVLIPSVTKQTTVRSEIKEKQVSSFHILNSHCKNVQTLVMYSTEYVADGALLVSYLTVKQG